MRSRSSLPAAFARPPTTGFLAAFAIFAGRSSSSVVRWAIKIQLYEPSILPQKLKGCLPVGRRHAAPLQSPLQRMNKGFEASGYFVGGCAGREGDRGADADGDFANVGEAAVFTFHLPDAVQAHRNDRGAKIFCEEADTALERRHAAIFRIVDFAFGKDDHAIAAVDGFTGKTKTFAEAGKLRQRKNVEE